VEGAFAGLSWPDAKNIAAAIAFDVTQRDDAVAFIRGRARRVTTQRYCAVDDFELRAAMMTAMGDS
jgi:hypothetical protein